jgi:regulatory protein
LVLKMDYRITALKAQKRNPNRVNVYLDGEYAFGLARIIAAWLFIGQSLTDERIKELQDQDANEVTFQAALRYLNYRPRSEAEIRQHLGEKGYTEPAIDTVIEKLREGHLLDDHQFARDWVENQNTFRPRGRRALEFELRHKGIAKETIEKTLEETASEEDLAYQAAKRQADRLVRLEWQEFRTKLSAFLARRGFSYETVAPTVRRIWAELRSSQAQHSMGDTNGVNEE